MKQPIILAAIIALVIGVGIGLGVATLFDDAPPALGSGNTIAMKIEADKESAQAPDSQSPDAKAIEPRGAVTPKAKASTKAPQDSSGEDAPTHADIASALAFYGVEEATGKISGTVTFEDGTAAQGATVQALLTPSAPKGMAPSAYSTARDDRGLNPISYRWDRPRTAASKPYFALVQTYSHEVTTDAHGKYSIKGLLNAPYNLKFGMAGARSLPRGVLNRGVTAEVGEVHNFTLQKVKLVQVSVTLPDGAEPLEAYVHFKDPTGRMSNEIVYRWTQEEREMPYPEGVFQVWAESGDAAYTTPSVTITFDEKAVPGPLKFRFEPKTRLFVSAFESDQSLKNIPVNIFAVAAHIGELESLDDIYSMGVRVTERGNSRQYENLEIVAGSYILYVFRMQYLVATQSLSIAEGETKRVELTLPPIAREHYIIANINGLDDPNEVLKFEHRIEGDTGRTAGGINATRRPDGSYWVWKEVGEYTWASKKYFLTAISKVNGRVEVEYQESSVATATLTFQAPATLKVKVIGFDRTSNQHLNMRLGLLPPAREGERLRHFLRSMHRAATLGKALDSDDIVLLRGYSPGTYELVLSDRDGSGDGPFFTMPISLVAGENVTTLTIPIRQSLNIQFTEGDAADTYRNATLFRNGERIDYQSAKNGIADFGLQPQGEYVVEARSARGSKKMTFTHASATPIPFVPDE